MYLVRFIRKDKLPVEEYLYNNSHDALYHFTLFVDDDSCLYEKIELVKLCSDDI